MFQLAGWYAIRARATQPVSYSWRDFNGTLQQQRDEVLADWPVKDPSSLVLAWAWPLVSGVLKYWVSWCAKNEHGAHL